MELPRGMRNKNPGNIERTGAKWSGMASKQTDSRFVVFQGFKWGLRALAKILITYQTKYKIRKPIDIIRRWAPDIENDPAAYAAFVAKRLGISMHDVVDLSKPEVLKPFVRAITDYETGRDDNGKWWMDQVPESELDEGIQLAISSVIWRK